jgi:hypothetical protein
VEVLKRTPGTGGRGGDLDSRTEGRSSPVDEHGAVCIGREDAHVTFHGPVWENGRVGSVIVSVHQSGLDVSRRVDLTTGDDSIAPYFESLAIAPFFESLAVEWKGWEGAREWSDGEFRMVCWHDGIGQVVIEVGLGFLPPVSWRDAGWRVNAVVLEDVGRLDAVAGDLHRLLGP